MFRRTDNSEIRRESQRGPPVRYGTMLDTWRTEGRRHCSGSKDDSSPLQPSMDTTLLLFGHFLASRPEIQSHKNVTEGKVTVLLHTVLFLPFYFLPLALFPAMHWRAIHPVPSMLSQVAIGESKIDPRLKRMAGFNAQSVDLGGSFSYS